MAHRPEDGRIDGRVCGATVIGAMLMAVVVGALMHITVDATHVVNTVRPVRAIGVAIDSDPPGKVPFIYAPAQTNQLRSAGLGSLSYRLYTELSVQDWHWNPIGTFSDAARQEGYWRSSTSIDRKPIVDSFGYVLPHRGDSHDQGDENGYSRIDDGDPTTYWKSNPYLTHRFTHEPDARHPQWVVVDLGARKPVNAIRIAWFHPFATRYDVQYWTGPDAVLDQGIGRWITFPKGRIVSAHPKNLLTRLAKNATLVRYVRVLMNASSNTCDTHNRSDPRNCVGYAVQNIALGHLTRGMFHNLVAQGRCVPPSHGRPNCKQLQTSMYVSTVDPWHRAIDRVRTNQDQPGLDIVARNPVTHGLPVMYPVPMLYSTPENAVAEIRYLESRGYPISYIELGEEADGQYITPEDYGALYVQWARAIHAVDPKLRLGGPAFTGVNTDIEVWRNPSGDVSWLHRFLRYLKARGSLRDLAFFSFEHYPFKGCDQGRKLQSDLLREPSLVRKIVNIWRHDGLPKNVPLFITESNFASDTTPVPKQLGGAIWFADWIGTALQEGVSGFNYYQYEAEPLSRNVECGLWGAYGMFFTDRGFHIRARAAQFYAAELITKYWLCAVDEDVRIYSASISEPQRFPVLTAYAAKRPDSSWSLLVVNKDRVAHHLDVRFLQPGAASLTFSGQVRIASFGASQYHWSGQSETELPDPNRGITFTATSTQTYAIPAQSIVVLEGTLARSRNRAYTRQKRSLQGGNS